RSFPAEISLILSTTDSRSLSSRSRDRIANRPACCRSPIAWGRKPRAIAEQWPPAHLPGSLSLLFWHRKPLDQILGDRITPSAEMRDPGLVTASCEAESKRRARRVHIDQDQRADFEILDRGEALIGRKQAIAPFIAFDRQVLVDAQRRPHRI